MKSFVVFLGFIALACAAPLEQRIETDPELTGGYFEGDIVIDDIEQRNGMTNTAYRWPNNTVYYKIVPGFFDDEHLSYIYRAMDIIQEVSCIKFKEATADNLYYSSITGNSDGCYSSVGYLRRVQTLNFAIYPLDSGCFRLGSVVHEWLHTLGFYHMQSDSHRDDYVFINSTNIQAGTQNNFAKYDSNAVDDYGQEYDYGSVLHYSAYAFSVNGEMTIVPLKEGGDVMGQRRGMSDKDINKLNIMYKCPIA